MFGRDPDRDDEDVNPIHLGRAPPEERDIDPQQIDKCPFCGADLTGEWTTAGHLEECDEFYEAFGEERPESESTDTSPPDPKYAKLSRVALEQAKEAGKWVGRAPTGFQVVDGYLQVDEEEYTAIADALDRVDAGESLWAVARDVDVVHDSTVRRIAADPDRRAIFTEQRAGDQRIQAALDEWSEGTETNYP